VSFTKRSFFALSVSFGTDDDIRQGAEFKNFGGAV